MTYERLDTKYVDGVTWDEAAVTRIDNTFERVYNDLYDTKVNDEWELVYQTCNINSPSYTNEYSSSVFSGWYGCIGKPQNFNKVIFPIKPRTDYPITAITVKVLEVPSWSEITLGTSTSSPYTPKPKDWTVLAEKTVSFVDEDSALNVGTYNLVECEFNDIIANEDGKYFSVERCK